MADELRDFRISALETAVSEVKEAVKSIDQSLKTLASLEVRHGETRDALGRAFDQLKEIDGRVRRIEQDMPTMRLVKGWVISGVVGCMGLVGMAVWKFVFG